MIELTPREYAPLIPRDIPNSFFKGVRSGANISLIYAAPLFGLEAGLAQPGEAVPIFTGRLVGLTLQPALTGLIAAGLTASIGCPPGAAVVVAMIAAGYVGSKIEAPMIKGLSFVVKSGTQARRLSFGGNYEDTVSDQKRRQRASRDLVGALPEARQWLGQEALILHKS
jgi:hypothetical protein